MTGNEIICKVCQENFILSVDSKGCYSVFELLECEIAANGGATCSQCKPGQYYETTTSKCKEGMIQHCTYYHSETKCNVCESNYMPISIFTEQVLCFEMSELNCDAFDLIISLQG